MLNGFVDVNFILYLDLTRSSCEKYNYFIDPLLRIETRDSGANQLEIYTSYTRPAT
jgi:hypothetical protein